MDKKIINQTFDEERALYNLRDTEVVSCTFAGEADGESVLKECRNIAVKNCMFSLRYPLWHVSDFTVTGCTFDERARASLWYDNNGVVEDCNVNAIKMLRECSFVSVNNSNIDSPEFGWKCSDIHINDTFIRSEYVFFDCKNLDIDGLKLSGKYSFQYNDGLRIKNSYLDTKDAFWHAKNIVVEDSVVKGEYLGWFSENLTLINCKIIGTQPLCYCKGLKLVNCTMEKCDLSFEYSDVEAKIIGHVDSIKNPKSGVIEVDSVDEIIREDAVTGCNAEIFVYGEKA